METTGASRVLGVGVLAAALVLTACGAPGAISPVSEAPVHERVSPAPRGTFDGGAAAARLRERMVGWAVAQPDPRSRLLDVHAALAALPSGHPGEIAVLESVDAILIERSDPRVGSLVDEVGARVAERWLARGFTARARRIVASRVAATSLRNVDADLTALVFRLEGRAAVEALLEEDAAGRGVGRERSLDLAAAEARFGEPARAARLAEQHPDSDACLVWNALVARLTRDQKALAAARAWSHARSAVIGGQGRHDAMECLADLARESARVGALDEVSRLFVAVVDDVREACR